MDDPIEVTGATIAGIHVNCRGRLYGDRETTWSATLTVDDPPPALITIGGPGVEVVFESGDRTLFGRAFVAVAARVASATDVLLTLSGQDPLDRA
ncbi:MAG TPA: hypothetical protein VM451_01235 [Candidatus Limnocylindria bacterium]|nr:hypothetical protein [Candidatus Limnocylindria bacterium]